MKTERDVAGGRLGAARRGTPPGVATAAEALDHLGALVGLDPGWTIRSATPGLARFVGGPAETVIGAPLGRLLAPNTAETTIAALAAAVQAGRRVGVPGLLRGARPVVLVPIPPAAPSATIEVVLADVLEAEGARAAHEVAEVFRARLLEVEDQLVEAAILSEIADDVTASLELTEVGPRLVDHAARFCRASCAILELVDPETGLLALSAVSGRPGGWPAAAPVPLEGTLAGAAIAAGTPIDAHGLQADTRYAPYVPGGGDSPAWAALAVPLVADGQPLGALVVYRRTGPPFSETEIARARRLARPAALALRNARRHAVLAGEAQGVHQRQAELLQGEKAAALERLAAGAAHEINNPLAAVVGNVELLMRREALSPPAKERAERILTAAYRVARVVERLLAFVRAQPPVVAPVDVGAVARDAVVERARLLALDHVRVTNELPALPVVQADARQIAQVVGHVLDNALDAVREQPGDGDRVIRLAGRAVPGGVELRIENSGSPIPAAVLPRIFDPFFTTKEVGRGAGLGLSVAHGIITAHGGRIRAENAGGMVAIVIELPLSGPRAA